MNNMIQIISSNRNYLNYPNYSNNIKYLNYPNYSNENFLCIVYEF